jgi:hypothetical protein
LGQSSRFSQQAQRSDANLKKISIHVALTCNSIKSKKH